jgi:hypothetical protein
MHPEGYPDEQPPVRLRSHPGGASGPEATERGRGFYPDAPLALLRVAACAFPLSRARGQSPG